MRTERQKMVFEKRGSILLMVLVLIIMVVAYVLTKFVERANVEIQGEGYYVERSRLRLHAWSYLEIAVAVLADVKAIDNAIYAPAQGWANPLEYAPDRGARRSEREDRVYRRVRQTQYQRTR